MKFELMGDWPCGAMIVPAGTVLEWVPPSVPQYRGVRLPATMPMNARALDQTSANALADWHPHHNHLLHCAKGIQPVRSSKI